VVAIARSRPLIRGLFWCGEVIEVTGFIKADGIVGHPPCDVILNVLWVGNTVVFDVVDM